jgi:predicted dehydrogenase
MADRKSGTHPSGLGVYSDYRELIAREDLDAVVVATPDHWHALCTIDALRAGKDVYCEKPVTHFFREGQQVSREVSKHHAIFQTGSQQRSDKEFRRAVELARNGQLGKITRVEVGLPPGYDGPQGDASVIDPPESLDYEFWCGPAPKLPYMRARHHRWWRGHRDFGGGVLMDWIGHHNDIAHWALGVDDSGPTKVTARNWTFPDTSIYNTPHQYTIECQYRGGVTSNISSRNPQGLKLIGDEGWVYVRRGLMEASQPKWLDPQYDPGEIRVYRSDNHARNFIDCVRSRRPCIAPAETAHRSITPGHLGYVSNALGRSLRWDPQAESVIDDAAANQLLQQSEYRAPWST